MITWYEAHAGEVKPVEVARQLNGPGASGAAERRDDPPQAPYHPVEFYPEERQPVCTVPIGRVTPQGVIHPPVSACTRQIL